MAEFNIAVTGDEGTYVRTPFNTWFPATHQVGNFAGADADGGFRFQNVTVDGEITSATFTIEVTSIVAGAVSMNILGEKSANCDAFANGDGPNDRAQTTEVIAQSFSATGSIAIDVTDIVQEILDQGGWVSGADLGILLINTDATTNDLFNFEGFGDTSPVTLSIVSPSDGSGGTMNAYHVWEMTQ